MVEIVLLFLYIHNMVKITYAKTNNDGSITIKATYTNQQQSHQNNIGIYKYFITKQPISTNPDTIERADVTLVAYYNQLENPVDSIDVTISDSNIIADTLNETLFVYVVTNDDELMLCSCKDKYDMTTVFPLCKVYKIFMGFVNSLNHDECNIPMNFIDQIMRYIYLMSAWSSGNHYRVKDIWDQYFKNTNIVSNSSQNCNCHG